MWKKLDFFKLEEELAPLPRPDDFRATHHGLPGSGRAAGSTKTMLTALVSNRRPVNRR